MEYKWNRVTEESRIGILEWMRMTDREKAYAEWVLDTQFEDRKFAIIDRNAIAFVSEDGKQEFLAAVQDEASYNSACGARTLGARLAAKIKDPSRLASLAARRPILGGFVIRGTIALYGLVAQLVRAPA